jgi:hypothetical protein
VSRAAWQVAVARIRLGGAPGDVVGQRLDRFKATTLDLCFRRRQPNIQQIFVVQFDVAGSVITVHVVPQIVFLVRTFVLSLRDVQRDKFLIFTRPSENFKKIT